VRLTVLSMGYPFAQVSESTAGGAEQVLSTLDEALVRAGHRSIVIAPEGSRVRGVLLPTPGPPPHLDDQQHEIAVHRYRGAIRSALARFPIDVVHMHGLDFVEYLPEPGTPVLVTLHLPPAWYSREAFRLARPDTHLICVSRSQASECPPGAEIRAIIGNGIRLQPFRQRRKRNYVMAMGRICPEKGLHLALDAATQSGLPLLLAGKVYGYPSHQTYFAEQIRPRLGGGNRFLGEIGPGRKHRLLAGARCLLVPSLVPETSSLGVMEAMASGTPIVAYRKGALVELIEHGRTGFIVDSKDAMAAAIRATEHLDPRVCRRQAELHFSAERMFEKYLFLYTQAAHAKSAPSSIVDVQQVLS